MNPGRFLLIVGLIASAACGARGKAPSAEVPAAPDAVEGSVQVGECDVQATGQDIVVEGPFDAGAALGKVQPGMSPGEVVLALGIPTKLECGGKPVKWFYTYELAGKQGNERWMILMVEFEAGKVSFSFWLPSG